MVYYEHATSMRSVYVGGMEQYFRTCALHLPEKYSRLTHIVSHSFPCSSGKLINIFRIDPKVISSLPTYSTWLFLWQSYRMINILTLNSVRCSMRYWVRSIYSKKVFLPLPSRGILKPDNGGNVAMPNNYNVHKSFKSLHKILGVNNIQATDMRNLISWNCSNY